MNSDTLTVTINTTKLLEVLIFAVLGCLVGLLLLSAYRKFAYDKKLVKVLRLSPQNQAVAPHENTKNQNIRIIPVYAGLVFATTILLLNGLFNFSQKVTLLPLAIFSFAAVIGMFLEIIKTKKKFKMSENSKRILEMSALLFLGIVTTVALLQQYDAVSVLVPFAGVEAFGWLAVLWLAIAMFLGIRSVGSLGFGLEGLSSGFMAIAFANMSFILLLQQQYELASLTVSVVGMLVGFLLINSSETKFIPGGVGTTSLVGLFVVIAAMTGLTVFLLLLLFVPLIGFLYLVYTAIRTREFDGILSWSFTMKGLRERTGWSDAKVMVNGLLLAQIGGVVAVVIYLAGVYGA